MVFFLLNALKIADSEVTLLHVPEECIPPFIIFRSHGNTCTEHEQYNGVQGYKAIPAQNMYSTMVCKVT